MRTSLKYFHERIKLRSWQTGRCGYAYTGVTLTAVAMCSRHPFQRPVSLRLILACTRSSHLDQEHDGDCVEDHQAGGIDQRADQRRGDDRGVDSQPLGQ